MFLHRLLALVFLLAMTVPPATAAMPESGVSQALARERATQVRNLRYAVTGTIGQSADTLRGTIVIRFDLAKRDDVVLDYRVLPDGEAIDWQVNGRHVSASVVNEHVVLKAQWLKAGANRVRFDYAAAIRASGRALTRYTDAADGAHYVYSLFVPADASSVFPCFDQPDLKARWSLKLVVPQGWRAIANATLVRRLMVGDAVEHEFAETQPLPSYLFAFAAGPFAALDDSAQSKGSRLFVRASQRERAEREAQELLRLSRESNAFFARYFDHPFPFDKHDLVLLPEFPYGGMEHAGAIFLREESMLFRAPPTAADRLRRANTILHENAHQWFGNLVTMRWFDDLWLKEGFANFAAAKAVEALLPEFDAWNALRAAKLSAYRTDVTQGTTAIWQTIANLADAKSAYGAIVYTKAPAVLRQAEFYLGDEVFERAVRQVIREHAYGNAEWRDLVAAFEKQSGRLLAAWADTWVRRRGMATVRIARPDQRDSAYTVTQSDTLDAGGLWPMRMRYAFIGDDGATTTQTLTLDGAMAALPSNAGAQPAIIVPNAGDYAYARFLLDPISVRNALAHPELLADKLTRALAFDALWEEVRDARLAPLEFIRHTLRVLPAESDPVTYAGLLARVAHAFRTWLSDAQRDAVAAEVEAALLERMRAAASIGERLSAMRTLTDCAWSSAGQGALLRLLDGQLQVGEKALAARDRFAVIARLLQRNHREAQTRLADETARAAGEDTRSFAYAAGAARMDAATKARYFEQFLSDPALAEDWIDQALAPFNAIEHEALTAPLFERALAALPELKRRHKIFFVGNWLSAFMGGQDERVALDVALRFASGTTLDGDLRLKVLEYADGLRRTVSIRQAYAR